MKINGVNRVTNIYKNNMVNKTNKVNQAKSKDTVELSSVAKDFQVAREMGKKVPDVRMEKVEEIKAMMQSNNYNIEGKEVAKKMVESGFDVQI
ncbi:flagellar biosynthesis anti-sigma factor FlgM [Vallitalea okinawensis]|uniref:flagellar biosynthesis anti-sigma factor FlgM n=1 Tax=Vallitalea okinawensis TaxID=2078660 RepID=UPI000CFDCC60|nr:flagellar biosynthesis anti-sigma factor FlgM [Vallitalea okinawensis]